MFYKFELENEEFEILQFGNDKEAIQEALNREDVFNIIKIDKNYNDIECIY